jgi:hypothetical protein
VAGGLHGVRIVLAAAVDKEDGDIAHSRRSARPGAQRRQVGLGLNGGQEGFPVQTAAADDPDPRRNPVSLPSGRS